MLDIRARTPGHPYRARLDTEHHLVAASGVAYVPAAYADASDPDAAPGGPKARAAAYAAESWSCRGRIPADADWQQIWARTGYSRRTAQRAVMDYLHHRPPHKPGLRTRPARVVSQSAPPPSIDSPPVVTPSPPARSDNDPTRWHHDRHLYDRAARAATWRGPPTTAVTGLAVRYGAEAAHHAALETDRAARLGRPVRSATALARHLAACYTRTWCARRHRGPCGPDRLQADRGRRLDEDEHRRGQDHQRRLSQPASTLPDMDTRPPERPSRDVAIVNVDTADRTLHDLAAEDPGLAAVLRRLRPVAIQDVLDLPDPDGGPGPPAAPPDRRAGAVAEPER